MKLLCAFIALLASIASMEAEELTGVFHKQTMSPACLEIDGPGLVKEIELSGDAVNVIPDNTHIWVDGGISTFLQTSSSGAQQPMQWHVVMAIKQWKQVEKHFERPDTKTVRNGEVSQDWIDERRKEAGQGDARAQLALGNCYRDGMGVKQDFVEAANWYRKAAEQGDATAQCFLGHCYRDGKGVRQDLNEAFKWYRKGAEQGDPRIQFVLSSCYYKGEGVKDDRVEAAKWLQKSAEQGFLFAQFYLGDAYEKGDGVGKNLQEAVKWYRKAAEQGHPEAKVALQRIEGEKKSEDPSN